MTPICWSLFAVWSKPGGISDLAVVRGLVSVCDELGIDDLEGGDLCCECLSAWEEGEVEVKMPRVRVVSRNFMEMVAALPAAKLDLLYDRHWTCQAVLRSLPPLAKQYVMRLLYVENAVSVKSLQEWAQPDALSKHQ